MNALLLLTALALTPPPPPAPAAKNLYMHRPSSGGPSPTENDFYWRRDSQSRSVGDYTAVPFGEGMTRPEMISGPSPQYTREALENRIEGVIIVKCRLPVDGSVRDCRVIKGLPYLNDVAVHALESRTYTPVKVHGKPIEVDYLFNLKFTLPDASQLTMPVLPSATSPSEWVGRHSVCRLEPRWPRPVGALLTLLGFVMLVLQCTPLWKRLPLSEAWRQTPALSRLFALAFAGFAAVFTLSTFFS